MVQVLSRLTLVVVMAQLYGWAGANSVDGSGSAYSLPTAARLVDYTPELRTTFEGGAWSSSSSPVAEAFTTTMARLAAAASSEKRGDDMRETDYTAKATSLLDSEGSVGAGTSHHHTGVVSVLGVSFLDTDATSAPSSTDPAPPAGFASDPVSCSALLLSVAAKPQTVSRALEPPSSSSSSVTSLAHLAYLNVVRVLQECIGGQNGTAYHNYDTEKVLLYSMDTLQDNVFEGFASAELAKLCTCSCIPEKNQTTLQALILSGFDRVMDHKFTAVLWNGALRQHQPGSLAEFVDGDGNNLLHLAVLSDNPRMVDKILQLVVVPFHTVLELEALLSGRNKNGLRPIDLVAFVTPTVRHGMRSRLKKQFRLVTLFRRRLQDADRHGTKKPSSPFFRPA